MRARSVLVVVLLLWCTALVRSPAVEAQRDPLAGLDAYIERAMREWEVPGLAIAVVRNDSVIYARGFGVRALGRPERVDEHTLFAIASTTKAMTAAALGMLVDEGRLDWDDHVVEHMPSYQLADPWVTRELTIRDLLTHRTGISRSDNLWIAGPFDRAEVLRRARYLPSTSGFRDQYGYHNVMYIAAGEVVAEVSGMSWDDFIASRLFAPLGMTRSTTRMAVVEARDNVAAPHTIVDGMVQAVALRNYDNIGGAGAAFSSVHDMAQWIRLQLNGGVYEGVRLLSPQVMRELHTPQVVLRMDTTTERMFPQTNLRAYALGWNVQDYYGRKLVHHSGSLNWTRTQVGLVPSERIGVIAVANLSTSNLQLALMYRVIDALIGAPERDWSREYLDLARRSDEPRRENQRIANTQPSLEPAGYAGVYRSELYGDVRITVENGRLVLSYAPDYIADLEHWHHDTFRATWRRAGFGSAFVTFSLDRRARPVRMELDGFGEFRLRPDGLRSDR